MKKFLYWLYRNICWLAEPRHFWICVGVAVFVPLLSLTIPKPLDDTIRYAGLALQVLGVATVVHALRGRGHLFGHPSFVASTRSWMARRPKLNPPSINLSAFASSQASASAALDVCGWRTFQANDAVETRLSTLACNLETLKGQLESSSARTATELAKLFQSLHNEQAARESQVQFLSTQILQFGAGSLHMEFIGVIWLTLGIVLATIPGEAGHLFLWAKTLLGATSR